MATNVVFEKTGTVIVTTMDDAMVPVYDCDSDDDWGMCRPGDKGTIVIRQDASSRATLDVYEEGVAGNSNPKVRRFHGHMLTPDGYVEAHGWRRVEKVERLAGGEGFVYRLSPDLRPDVK